MQNVDTPHATQAIVLELTNTGIDDPESYVLKTLDCADVVSIRGKCCVLILFRIYSVIYLSR